MSTAETRPSLPIQPTQVFRVYIKASPEAIWQAITSPEWSERYGYRGRVEYELHPGGAFRTHGTAQMVAMGLPEVIVDGEVLECDPPKRLVHSYRMNFTPEHVAEGFTRVTWEIEPASDTITRLTVIHEVEDAPIVASDIAGGSGRLDEGAGGWPWILSDLKSVLESGGSMQD